MDGRPPEPDDEREPTPDAEDIDVRFADITASLGDLTVPPAAPPEDESPDSAPDRAALRPLAGPRDYELGPETEPRGDEDEAGYVPPEPPPLAAGEPLITLAWAGVAAPILLVLAFFLGWRSLPGVALAIGGVVFVVSVGVLIWRLPERRDPDDHDDGAVV